MIRFHQFVEENFRWFRGRCNESTASLDAAERTLGVSIPGDIRWLLSEHGYWHATGISSLDEIVTDTLAARQHLSLPNRFLVLYNHQDGGVILLDTIADNEGNNEVYNEDWSAVPDRIGEDIQYTSYLEYVKDVLENERAFIAEKDVAYDPSSDHR